MLNKSHLLNAFIFTSAILAWYLVRISYNSDSILKEIYGCALAATLVIYVASVIFKNVSLYDTYWGLQGTLLSLSYYYSTETKNKRLLIATILSCIWSIRLTLVFVMYSWNDIYAEDWRYRLLRNKANNRLLFSIRSLLLHYFLPMNIGFFGHMAFYYLSKPANLPVNFLDYFGMTIMTIGILIETIADYQLRATVYKQKRIASENGSGTNEKLLMNTGLWSLCRHPNYFGEFLYWFGLYVYGYSSGNVLLFDWFYLTSFILGAFAVYLVLNYVSIPFMEKRQLKRRPDSYKKYIVDVPYKFFPLNFF